MSHKIYRAEDLLAKQVANETALSNWREGAEKFKRGEILEEELTSLKRILIKLQRQMEEYLSLKALKHFEIGRAHV